MMSRNRRKTYTVYTPDYSWRNWVPKYNWRKPNGSHYKVVKSRIQAIKLAKQYGSGSDIVVRIHHQDKNKGVTIHEHFVTWEYTQESVYPPILLEG